MLKLLSSEAQEPIDFKDFLHHFVLAILATSSKVKENSQHALMSDLNIAYLTPFGKLWQNKKDNI